MSFWELNTNYFEKIALIDEEQGIELTYKAMYDITLEVEKEFIGLPKSLVIILVTNSFISLILYLAILRAGHTIMLLDENVEEKSLDSIIKNFEVNFILSRKPINIAIGNSEKKAISVAYYYKSSVHPVHEITIHHDLSLMLSTSGSTGSSKFVKLTRFNLNSNAISIVEYLKIDENQIAITTLPMHYSFGLSIVNSHLQAGASIVLTNKSVVQKKFWELFNKYKCTTFSGVPYTYHMLQKLKFNTMKLPTLQYFTQAGGHLNSESKKYFLDYASNANKKFIVMYGQTEATARISYVPFEKLRDKIESIGIPIPGGSLCIYHDNQHINEPDKIGEIVYVGENVMLGYATSRSSLKLGDELGGVLRTGDLGKFDIDGFFYVTGRMKRFLKVFGNRLSLDELERMLEVEFATPFAVTGTDDKVCVLSENLSLEKQVLDFLSKKTNIHFSAFVYSSIIKLPISANGKKDYNQIRGMFLP